jgi:hypothetical protein
MRIRFRQVQRAQRDQQSCVVGCVARAEAAGVVAQQGRCRQEALRSGVHANDAARSVDDGNRLWQSLDDFHAERCMRFALAARQPQGQCFAHVQAQPFALGQFGVRQWPDLGAAVDGHHHVHTLVAIDVAARSPAPP